MSDFELPENIDEDNWEDFEVHQLKVSSQEHDNYKRLDQFLDTKFPDFSRTYIKKLFKQKLIQVEKGPEKIELKKMPPPGTIISVAIPPQAPSELLPENIPLEILHEDEHLVIVNKPAGLVTHPAPGHPTGTLVNAILHHCPHLEGMHDQKRPGIVHRLDKGTSGVMVVAKGQKTHEALVEIFSQHAIERIYQAITLGPEIPVGGTLKSTIGRHSQNRLKMQANPKNGGKSAITYYKKISSFKKLHHLELKLETGRTHQIRVHLSQLLKHPILCDPIYASPSAQLNTIPEQIKLLLQDYPHPLLHARVLGFTHPISKKEIYIESPPPTVFSQVLELMEKIDE